MYTLGADPLRVELKALPEGAELPSTINWSSSNTDCISLTPFTNGCMIFFNDIGISTITVSHDDPDVESLTVDLTVERGIATFAVTAENRNVVGFTGENWEHLKIPATFIGDDGIEYTVTSIENSAFSGCSKLNQIIIPETVTTIGTTVFDNCDTLNLIKVNHNHEGISGAPWGATDITDVVWLKAPIATGIRLDGFDPEKTYNEGETIRTKLIPLPEGSRFPLVGDDETIRPFVSRSIADRDPAFNEEIINFNNISSTIDELEFLSAGSARIYIGFIIDSDYNDIHNEDMIVNVAAVQHYQVTFDDDCNEVSAYPSSIRDVNDTSGSYRAGRQVNITCKDSAIDQFVQWSCDDPSVEFADKTNPTTYFIMPDHDIVIDHTFITHSVTISGAGVGATGAGEYIPGKTVTITPGTKEGFEFVEYTCTNTTVQTELNDETPGTFVMPEADTEVVIVWNQIAPINFMVSKENRAMVGYTGAANEELVIPETFTGDDGVEYKVVGIASAAFNECTNLTSVKVPEGINEIRDWAFGNCSSLTTFDIPNGVASINNNTFYKCTNLTSVTIPESVTSIGDSAFYNCKSLTSITIPNSVSIISNNAFQNCTKLTSITIPNSVTTIGNNAFEDCTKLTSITIPNSVTSIGIYAFEGCTSLTSVIISDGVISIGPAAFWGCTSLTSVTIPESVTSIGNSTFRNCSALTTITIPDGVTSIGSSTFEGCTNLSSVTLPNTITNISSSTFYNCSALTSVNIPNSVKTIDKTVFSGCTVLTTINIDNVTGAITGAPWSAPNATVNWLRTVSCQLTVTDSYAATSGAGVYYEGSEVTINAGTRDGYTFSGWTSNNSSVIFADSSAVETTITMPGEAVTVVANWDEDEVLIDFTVTNNNRDMIGYTDDTEVLDIPATFTGDDGVNYKVVSINDSTFTNCTSLTSVTIPEGVTSIGNGAFRNCSALTTITIPDGVKSIGGSTFHSCTSLTSIDIPNSVTSIDFRTFRGCTSLTSVTIPEGVTTIGENAFRGCESLISIDIPNSVTSIDSTAFNQCYNLSTINVDNTVNAITGAPWSAPNATVNWLRS